MASRAPAVDAVAARTPALASSAVAGSTRPNALLNRDFLLVWQGQLVSQLGSQVFLVAIVLWLQQSARSATLLGLLMMAATLPAVLVGPLGGALADRYSRRALLVGCDLASGCALLALAAALYAVPAGGWPVIGVLFAVAAVVSAVNAVFQPAVQSLVPDLVGGAHVASANALVQASFRAGGLLAQGLGGVLFLWLGAPLVALVDGLSYVFSAVSEAFIRVPPRPARAPGGSSLRRELGEGLAYVRSVPGMLALFATAALLQFFIVPFGVLLPFYVSGHLHARPDWYGFLMAAAGAGALAGYLVAGPVRTSGRVRSRLVAAGLVGMSLALFALALVRHPAAALGLVFAVGVMDGFVNVKLVTLLQTSTPTAVRGRVFGFLRTLTGALAPLAMLLAGIAADLAGRDIPRIYSVCGVAMLVSSLLLVGRRDCRAFLSAETAPAAV